MQIRDLRYVWLVCLVGGHIVFSKEKGLVGGHIVALTRALSLAVARETSVKQARHAVRVDTCQAILF